MSLRKDRDPVVQNPPARTSEKEDLNYGKAIRGVRFCLVAFFFLGLVYVSSPFIVTLICSGFFALALYGAVRSLKRFHRSLRLRVSVVLLIFFIGGMAPAGIASYRIATLIQQATSKNDGDEDLGQFSSKIVSKASTHFRKWGLKLGLDENAIQQSIDKSISKLKTFGAQSANQVLVEVPDVIMHMFVLLVALYSFLMQADGIRFRASQALGLPEKNFRAFVKSMQAACRSVLISNVVVGVVQAGIVSFGALIFGINEFWLIFVATFLISFIPVLGAGPVAFALAFGCLFQGRTEAFWGMAVTGTIAGTIDNIIRPMFLSDGTDVPVVIGLVAVIGGVIVLGIPGLLIGPLTASLVINSAPHLLRGFHERFHVESDVSKGDPATVH